MRPKRKKIPIGVKLKSALHALGLDPDDVQYDHDPALGMRPVDPATGDTTPPANDWRHIVPRASAEHKVKTFGNHAPLSGDVSKIAKLNRVEGEQAAFRARLLAKHGGEAPAPKKGRPWPSRGFARGPKR